MVVIIKCHFLRWRKRVQFKGAHLHDACQLATVDIMCSRRSPSKKWAFRWVLKLCSADCCWLSITFKFYTSITLYCLVTEASECEHFNRTTRLMLSCSSAQMAVKPASQLQLWWPNHCTNMLYILYTNSKYSTITFWSSGFMLCSSDSRKLSPRLTSKSDSATYKCKHLSQVLLHNYTTYLFCLIIVKNLAVYNAF